MKIQYPVLISSLVFLSRRISFFIHWGIFLANCQKNRTLFRWAWELNAFTSYSKWSGTEFKGMWEFLAFSKQTFISETAAIVLKTFRSVQNTWETINNDSTQIYSGQTFTCPNFTYINLTIHQINIRLNTPLFTLKKEKEKRKRTKQRLKHLSLKQP